jgi:ACS family hexuronate transporter-like MFS transporter
VGIFNAGANVGAVLTPLIVPAITLAYGWRMAFIATGALSLVWLVAWIAIYRQPSRHPCVGAEELALIGEGGASGSGGLRRFVMAAIAWFA